jgi:hypothetical protein
MSTDYDYARSPKALTDLKALNALFIHNFITNDVASHEAILHAEFIAIQSDGVRMAREPYLERWKNGFDPEIIPYWDVRDECITVVGDVALVRATNKHVVRRNRTETIGMTTYTDTYLLDGGAWKCIQAQLTPVQPGNEPGDATIISVYINGVKQKLA